MDITHSTPGGSATTSPLHSGKSSSVKFPLVKCEFCDTTLKKDLDVSKHLTSSPHGKKLEEFVSTLNPHDKVVEKNTPKNLTKLLQTLKLRSVKDLKDLTDKGYFDLVDEKLTSVAEELIIVLTKSLIEYETKDQPEQIRNNFLEPFIHPEKSPEKESPRKLLSNNNNNNSNNNPWPAQNNPPQFNPEPTPPSRPSLVQAAMSSGQPYPRLNSTYIPQLARIKKEPKF